MTISTINTLYAKSSKYRFSYLKLIIPTFGTYYCLNIFLIYIYPSLNIFLIFFQISIINNKDKIFWQHDTVSIRGLWCIYILEKSMSCFNQIHLYIIIILSKLPQNLESPLDLVYFCMFT